MVEPCPRLRDGGGVGQHADGALHLGKVAAGHHGGWLVVDADLETGGAPVHELDGALGLDGRNGRVHVLGHDVTTVQHATRHVLAVAWIAFHHLVGGLEAGIGDLSHRQLLVVRLLGGDDWCVSHQREVDTRVGHQVGLELCKIDVEGAVEAQGGGDGRHDLADEPVQVGVCGALDVEVAAADVVDGLVVDHEGAVGVLQSGVGGQNGVVRFDDSGGDLGGGVDGKFELGLLSVVYRETFHQERSETGSGATTERVEDEEALESGALVGELADAVEDQVDDFLADGVVTASIVVGRVFLTSDKLFWVKQLSVCTSANLICEQRDHD